MNTNKQTQVIGSSNRVEGCYVVASAVLLTLLRVLFLMPLVLFHFKEVVKDTFILTKSLYYCTNFCTLAELMNNILNVIYELKIWQCLSFFFDNESISMSSVLFLDVDLRHWQIWMWIWIWSPFLFVCLSHYFSELPGNPENNVIGR